MSIVTIKEVKGVVACTDDGTAEHVFNVKNATDKALRVCMQLSIDEPVSAKWLQLEGSTEHELDVETMTQVSVKIQVPSDCAPGKYSYRLRVYDPNNPGDDYTDGDPVYFEVGEKKEKESPIAGPKTPRKTRLALGIGAVALTLALSVIVVFVFLQYTITATSGPDGRISPAGSVSVFYGGSKTFTITPKSGYSIADVKVDGESVGARSSYTIKDVSNDHKIEARFSTFSTQAYYQIINKVSGFGLLPYWSGQRPNERGMHHWPMGQPSENQDGFLWEIKKPGRIK
jgi:hypothetical protein